MNGKKRIDVRPCLLECHSPLDRRAAVPFLTWMARFKTFDEVEILGKAVRQFWEYGFDGTSMKDLAKVTGLSNGSLYNAFGDKETIFLKSLAHYEASVIEPRIVNYLQADDVHGGLQTYFQEATEAGTSGRFLGCLVVNSYVDGRSRAAEVQQKISAIQKKVDLALAEALERAQSLGIVHDSHDPRDLAAQINLMMSGILLRGRLQADQAERAAALETVWRVIEQK